MARKRELFYYNWLYPEKFAKKYGDRYKSIISEAKLPRPTMSKKYKGKCALFGVPIPQNLKLGSKINIAIGDPIILRGAILVSRDLKGVPAAMRRDAEFLHFNVLTFVYKGKKVWVEKGIVCLLKDLK